MEEIFQIVIDLIEIWGYPAILIGMALESANIPIPSELIFGFAGYLVFLGRLDFNSAVIAGVVAKTSTFQDDIVPAGKDVLLLKGASVFVHCETACTEGATVYVRHTVNGTLEIGDVRADVDTDKAKAVNAKFAETLTTAGLVEIEINL